MVRSDDLRMGVGAVTAVTDVDEGLDAMAAAADANG